MTLTQVRLLGREAYHSGFVVQAYDYGPYKEREIVTDAPFTVTDLSRQRWFSRCVPYPRPAAESARVRATSCRVL